MSTATGRKYFPRVLSVLILGLAALYPQPASAYNPARCVVDSDFGSKETAILKKACNLAVVRLQNAEVRKRVYELAKYSRLSGSVMRRSNAADTPESRWNLLNRQLLTLSLPNGENDTEPPFPDIFIEYEHQAPRTEGEGWLGRAPLDRVVIYRDGNEWKQKGSFRITINDYFVARGKRYSDPNEWAGTIAHEMLHNLGHHHPSSGDSDWNKYQINVLDAVVQNYGYGYKGSLPAESSTEDCGVTEVSVTRELEGNDGESTTVSVRASVKVTGGGRAKVTVNGRVVD